VTAIENYAATNEFSSKTAELLKKATGKLSNSKDQRKIAGRIALLLGEDTSNFELRPGEAWSDAANASLKKMAASKRSAWSQLLSHCQTASGGSPKEKWLEEANQLVKKISPKSFVKTIESWMPLVAKPRTVELPVSRYRDPNLFLDELNAEVLKGLMWAIPLSKQNELAGSITPVAMTAYKKVPGHGPRAVSLGNSCLYALGQFDGIVGVAQLAILKVRVKFGTAQRLIEKALVQTAERVGIPRSELEEMSVPAYGLEEVGLAAEKFGDFTAEMRVRNSKAEINWFAEDGSPRKTEPAAAKAKFKKEISELKKQAKDIAKMLPAQVARIEQNYLPETTWEFDKWKQRYIDHPLVGTIARRLIWELKDGRKKKSAIFYKGKFVGHDGKQFKPTKSTTVKLWHPITEPTKQILAWRQWLNKNEIVQPFKQAHREVYLLTDAEKKTKTYSNRFAAHVLKQHQFNALCGARGWKNTLRLMVDSSFPPALLLIPKHDLRAEFWIEGAGDEYGSDTNETGTFYYLTTDQVRFYKMDAETNLADAYGGGYGNSTRSLDLKKIPKLVLSEVLRDVDLFVGVASVGNDPSWYDGGPDGRYRDYWQSFSFGSLSETAKTRKSLLENLIPRLAIADRCHFENKFLVVKGDIRSYKIHLGSGNILMKPNDQYLCIVAKQSVSKDSNQVFLPFEGDRLLSIILSKAFLLAADSKIKDKTITSQIKQKT